MFEFKVEGFDELFGALLKTGQRVHDAGQAAGYTIAGDVVKDAQVKVPVASGELQQSAFVERTSPAVGGFGAEHAAAVHEISKDHARGQWKFLQTTLTDKAGGLESRAAELLTRYVEDGTTLATAPLAIPEVPASRPNARPIRKRRSK